MTTQPHSTIIAALAACRKAFQTKLDTGACMHDRSDWKALHTATVIALAAAKEQRAEVLRLKRLVHQAFDAIDNHPSQPKRFVKYPCADCGEPVSNAGFARRSHERGTIHRAALDAKARSTS